MELLWGLSKAEHQQRAAAIHTAESRWTFMDSGCQLLFGRMFGFIALSGSLLEGLKMSMLSEDPVVWGDASPLLRYSGHESRQGLQREDGDKVGHFTIAIVFESQHLSLAIHRRCLPQGPTYINQSDKRDALAAFLSLRLPVAIKELLLTHILNGCYLEDLAFIAIGGYRLYSLLTSAA